jgi:hypothetical protein
MRSIVDDANHYVVLGSHPASPAEKESMAERLTDANNDFGMVSCEEHQRFGDLIAGVGNTATKSLHFNEVVKALGSGIFGSTKTTIIIHLSTCPNSLVEAWWKLIKIIINNSYNGEKATSTSSIGLSSILTNTVNLGSRTVKNPSSILFTQTERQ